LRKKGKSYVVVKKEGGKIVAGNKTELSHDEAMKAMQARYAAESGHMKSK